MVGRPNKYDTHVKPRFEEIEKWLEIGVSEKEIAKNLGITKNSFIKYKNENMDLFNLIKKSRKKPVEEIKAAMLKRAIGFQYQEIKVIKDENGTRKETTTKTALPSETAGIYLLQHWAKDEGWSRDPQMLELKKQELKLKEKQAENDSW